MSKDKTFFDWFVKKHGRKNIGWRHERMKFPCHSTDRERAFAKSWRKEAKHNRGLNYGNGILQDNFCDSDGMPGFSLRDYEVLTEITNRDRVIVATIIQWLGTNVGFCWLTETLKNAGYKVIKIES